eukprot:3910878-Rhodomonas_salina.2
MHPCVIQNLSIQKDTRYHERARARSSNTQTPGTWARASGTSIQRAVPAGTWPLHPPLRPAHVTCASAFTKPTASHGFQLNLYQDPRPAILGQAVPGGAGLIIEVNLISRRPLHAVHHGVRSGGIKWVYGLRFRAALAA